MKAVFITGINRIEIREVAAPVMGPYEALCQMLFGATCSGTDLHILDGTFPWISALPTIPGHESVGRVIAVGNKVRHYREGDLVTRVGTPPAPDGSYSVTWGGFASLGLASDHWAMRADGLPPQKWNSLRVNQIIPSGIDPAAATMIITWRETLSYLRRMGMAPGMKVLVAGNGGVGMAFCNMAANCEAAVVACLGSPARRTAVAAAGATAVLDYHDPQWSAQAEAISEGGFDLVIDAVGKNASAQTLARLVKAGGSLAVYGMDEMQEYRISPRLSKSIRIFNGGYDEEETHQQVIDWMRSGKLEARHWLPLDTPLPLEKINQAYNLVRERQAIKALVDLQ